MTLERHQKHAAMIKTEKEYYTIIKRVEDLLGNPDNIENQGAKGYGELNYLSDLVADYEERHFPVENLY